MSGGTGFLLPKRWPTREELQTHSLKMGAARAAFRAGSFVPTVLGRPTVKDQGGSAACFGFSSVQGVHIWRQARNIVSALPSPVVPYWAARREQVSRDDDVVDEGSDPDGMIRALADFGASSWESCPFDINDVNGKPGGVTLTDAQKILCRLNPIFETGNELWTAIQHTIQYDRAPVLCAVEVTPAFDRCLNGVIDDPSGTSRGLHAQCLYGFREEGALTANSWNTGWGNAGTALMTPRFMGANVVWAGRLEVVS